MMNGRRSWGRTAGSWPSPGKPGRAPGDGRASTSRPAAGFTGFFGYVFGSAIAGTGVGWIADHWGWNGVFLAMIVCCLLTMIFSALTLRHRTTSSARPA